MGAHASTVPYMSGSATSSFPSTPHVVGPVGTKETLNKVFSLSHDILAVLFAIVQFCVRIFVFAAIVLWPWESAW
jgi:hypothetical protein